MSAPDEGLEFSPEDGWTLYNAGTQEGVEHSLKKLVNAVARGLNLHLFEHEFSDLDKLVEQVKDELHRLAETAALRNAVEFEFGFEPKADVWKPSPPTMGV